jgi:hypothetical protein
MHVYLKTRPTPLPSVYMGILYYVHDEHNQNPQPQNSIAHPLCMTRMHICFLEQKKKTSRKPSIHHDHEELYTLRYHLFELL